MVEKVFKIDILFPFRILKYLFFSFFSGKYFSLKILIELQKTKRNFFHGFCNFFISLRSRDHAIRKNQLFVVRFLVFRNNLVFFISFVYISSKSIILYFKSVLKSFKFTLIQSSFLNPSLNHERSDIELNLILLFYLRSGFGFRSQDSPVVNFSPELEQQSSLQPRHLVNKQKQKGSSGSNHEYFVNNFLLNFFCSKKLSLCHKL